MKATYKMTVATLLLAMCLYATASQAAVPPSVAAADNVAKVPVDLFVMSKCP